MMKFFTRSRILNYFSKEGKSRTSIFVVLLFILSISQIFANGSEAIMTYYIDNNVKEAVIIEQELINHSDIHEFQLFTHGRPGELLIEGEWLNTEGIAEVLKSKIASTVTHINIYGCEFGKGEQGRNAVSDLERRLCVSVSASDDITGKDGDWELEIGSRSTSIVFSAYPGNLQYADTDDFDGDGIINELDLDDDNDGIVDAVENPTCFYSVYETRIPKTPTTGFTWNTTTQPFTNTYDNNNVSYSQLTAALAVNGRALIEFYPNLVHNIPVSQVAVIVGTASISSSSTVKFRLEGWNTATSSWSILSTEKELLLNTNNYFVNSLFPDMTFQRYRIAGSTAGNSSNNGRLAEVWINYKNYNPSFQPKPTCTGSSTDIDNDAIPNQFDLDSDGDGTSDSFEAGAITTEVVNHQFNPITDANNDGLHDGVDTDLNGIPNYTYTPYAYIKDINTYKDSDGDTYDDLTDLDDDNDGILDCVEGGSTGIGTAMEVRNIITSATSAPNTANFTNSLGDTLITVEGTQNGNGAQPTTRYFGITADNTLWQQAVFGNAAGQKVFWHQYQLTQYVAGLVHFETVTAANASPVPASAHEPDAFSWDFDPSLLTATLVSYTLSTNPSYQTPANLQLNGVNINVGDEIAPGLVYDKAREAVVVVAFKSKIFNPKGTVYTIRSYYVHGSAIMQLEEYGIRSLIVQCPILDKDKDGIPNHLDLDSDGDGCPDALEGGAGFSTTVLKPSAMDGGNSGAGYNGSAGPVSLNLGTVSDGSGRPSLSGIPQSVATSQTHNATFVPGSPCAILLPIDLLNFNSEAKQNDAILSWTTLNEYENDYFNVERSYDGSYFQNIGSVKGAGISNTIRHYNFIDKNIGSKEKNVYYRLNQVDYNGKNNYSDIKLVQFNINQLSVFPNPVSNILKFSSSINNGLIEIYNSVGQNVISFVVQGNEVNLENLKDGVYFIRIKDLEGSVILNKRFIKISN